MATYWDFCGNRTRDDIFWDPDLTINTQYPDLTRCFQRTVLLWVPSGFLLLSAIPFVIRVTTKNKPINKWHQKGALQIAKLALSCLLVCLSLAELVYAFTDDDPPPMEYCTPAVYMLTYLCVMIINHLEYSHGRQTAGIVIIYWLMSLVVACVTLQSKIRRANQQDGISEEFYFGIFIPQFCVILVQLILANLRDKSAWHRHYKQQKRKQKERHEQMKRIGDSAVYGAEDIWALKPSKEEQVTFLEFILYTWINKMVWRGYKTELTDDYCPVIGRPYRSYPTDELFGNTWDYQIKAYTEENGPIEADPVKAEGFHKWLLLKSLWLACGWSLALAQFYRLISITLDFMNPQLLKLLIEFIDSDDEYSWKGYFLAAVLLLNNILRSLLTHIHFRMTCVSALHAKMALTTALYKKVMNLSSTAHKSTNVGEIVNMITVDVERIQDACFFIQSTWATPLILIGAMVFLWLEVGASCLAGLALILVFLPYNGIYIGRKVAMLQGKLMVARDKRCGIIAEILSGIKVLKLYGWEPSFEERVNESREKEVSVLRNILIWNALSSGFLYSTSALVSLAIFTVYSLDSSNVLDADKAFVSMSLIQLLMVPILILPLFINFAAQAYVAMERVARLLFASTVDSGQIEVDPTLANAVEVKEGYFGWDIAEEPVLKNINMKVEEGSLIAVVGQVGSGKSSLIHSLLGETISVGGSVKLKGSTAFVPQQAWMQNATVRDNITFGETYDEQKYSRVMEACALKKDMEILDGGDLTEIGEKGINLSGGQKQRVSLCRAVYMDKDIYLLDDPLSAVDSHVGKHIFDHVIGPNGLLAKKTRILVTHGLAYLPHADCIYVISEGEVAEHGTYHQLLEQNNSFAEFLRTYANEEQNKNTVDENVQLMRQLSRQSSRNSKRSSLRPRRRSSTVSLRSTVSRRDSVSEAVTVGGAEDLDTIRPETRGTAGPEASETVTKIIETETTQTGQISMTVVRTYIRAFGHTSAVVSLVCWIGYIVSQVAAQLWLAEWTAAEVVNGTRDADDTRLYNSVYGIIVGVQVFLLLALAVVLALACAQAARILHQQLLKRILAVPLSFFDITPVGRILNRFTKEQDGIDTMISMWIRFFMLNISPIIAVFAVISIITPLFLVVLVPLLGIYLFVQSVYMCTLRQLKRIDSVKRSPIYAGFDETMTGISSIRAYQQQDRFIHKMFGLIDDSYTIWNMVMVGQRWIAIYLEFFGALIVFFASLFAVVSRDSSTGSSVGVSVSFALQVTGLLNIMVRSSTELESYVVCVEKVKEYIDLDIEAPWVIEDRRPKPGWPTHGAINFQRYSTRYRAGLDLVLRDLECSIRPGERVGIVGRTGAGKSSMTLALFRILEAAKGSILVDNVDTAQIGLHDLRSKLTIIPQDPVVFSGSLRGNIDPFNRHTDEQVWGALELAYLKKFVSELPEGLMYECGENGDALSVGQRQLVCLARAVLRRSKVLVLDEATAAVDLETDDLIQATIRHQFKGCTVITIAHRLNTIMDYDRIMVLDKGEIREFGSPSELLRDTGGIFYSMVQDAGLITTIQEDPESLDSDDDSHL